MIKLLIGVTKWAGAGVLTVLLAWQASSTPVFEVSEVVVHVGVGDVEVRIDDHRFSVDRPWARAVVCELPPGDHLLTMQREGVEIYREVFTLENGRGRVLTAWDEHGLLDPQAPGQGPESRPRIRGFEEQGVAVGLVDSHRFRPDLPDHLGDTASSASGAH